MSKNARYSIVIMVIVALVGAVLLVDSLRRTDTETPVTNDVVTDNIVGGNGSGNGFGGGNGSGNGSGGGNNVVVEEGALPIYLNDTLFADFGQNDLDNLSQSSFIDAEEGKEQSGWMLRDILLLNLDADQLTPETRIIISSSARDKSVELTWAQVDDVSNMVMFDVSTNRGTVKLVSQTIDILDTRDEWVQDVDRIQVFTNAE